jgi:hypothetical protein
MKRVFIFLLGIATIVTSCKGPKDKITVKDDEGNTATVSVSDAAKKIEEGAKKAEELKKLPQLSIDQVKALIPDQLLGMPRSSFSANSAAGYAVAEGTYKGEGDKELNIQIIDCAGEMGSLWYNTQLGLWNFEREDDNGYEKTINFNGGKAVEKYTKSNERYELTSFANDRFMVHVEGEKVSLDDIKNVTKGLNLKVN